MLLMLLYSATFSQQSGNHFLPDFLFEQNLVGRPRIDLKKDRPKRETGICWQLVRVLKSTHAKHSIKFSKALKYLERFSTNFVFSTFCWYNSVSETSLERFSNKGWDPFEVIVKSRRIPNMTCTYEILVSRSKCLASAFNGRKNVLPCCWWSLFSGEDKVWDPQVSKEKITQN